MGMLDVKLDGGFFTGIGDAVSGIINTVKGQLPPEKQAELAMRQKELENQIILAQTSINAAEAASPRMFVSGWRPAIGWVCAVAMIFQYLLRPFLLVLNAKFAWGLVEIPGLDSNLWELLLGMLGLGGLRTYEKMKGVART